MCRGSDYNLYGFLYVYKIKNRRKLLICSGFNCLIGGKAGIRTLGTRKGTTVFETAPIDHSGTFPNGLLRVQSYVYFLIPQVFARQFLSTNFLCDCQIGNRLSQKDIFWRIMRGGHSINGIFANFVT